MQDLLLLSWCGGWTVVICECHFLIWPLFTATLRVSNSPRALFKTTRFPTQLRLHFLFILVLWIKKNCRTFLVVAELCAIAYLRALGRKLDAGQCVTLHGAAFTLRRWKAVQTPCCLRLVRALPLQLRRPFSIRLLFMCFVFLQNWKETVGIIIELPFPLLAFVWSPDKYGLTDFFWCWSKRFWFDTFGGKKTHEMLVVVGFCVKLLLVWFWPVWITFVERFSCNDSVTLCRVCAYVKRSACMGDVCVDLWGFGGI